MNPKTDPSQKRGIEGMRDGEMREVSKVVVVAGGYG